MKKIKILLFLFTLIPLTAKSLSVFEFSLVGVGAGILYDQYFDKSLTYDSETKRKVNIMNDYYNSMRGKISSEKFNSLPIQEKLLIIEDINFFSK
tara:strand:- start:634 stop:918 length:285 start_codon:yes stop_codon:yes gene_type:complete